MLTFLAWPGIFYTHAITAAISISLIGLEIRDGLTESFKSWVPPATQIAAPELNILRDILAILQKADVDLNIILVIRGFQSVVTIVLFLLADEERVPVLGLWYAFVSSFFYLLCNIFQK